MAEPVDPRRTALVLIDLMDRIVGQPLEPRPGVEVFAAAESLATSFREHGAPVVLVRVERPNVAEHRAAVELDFPRLGSVIAAADLSLAG